MRINATGVRRPQEGAPPAENPAITARASTSPLASLPRPTLTAGFSVAGEKRGSIRPIALREPGTDLPQQCLHNTFPIDPVGDHQSFYDWIGQRLGHTAR